MTSLGHARFPVIALCASQGGLDVLRVVLGALPRDLPAAIIVAQHRAPTPEHSRLANILDSSTALDVSPAADGDFLRPGHVKVIPTAKHLLVGTDDRVRLIDVAGMPPARPSADLLLCTLAVASGPRAIAVILSGNGHDGALGAQAIHAYGGEVLVQDEQSAQAPGMPSAAKEYDNPSAALAPPAIARALLSMIVDRGEPPG